MGKHRGNDLLHPFFATRRLRWRQQPLYLSLSLCLYTQLRSVHIQLQNVQQHNYVFALSHIYTHMTFVLFTHMAPKGAHKNTFTYVSLLIGQEVFHQVLDNPIQHNFPFGGTCFPTIRMTGFCPYINSAGMNPVTELCVVQSAHNA